MKKQTLASLITCAVLGAAMMFSFNAYADGAPGGGAPGGAGVGAGAPGGRGAGRGPGGGRGNAQPPGPPATVPAEVAIGPTPDELAKINADIKAMIATSPDKELLTKYQNLLTITAPDNPSIRPAPSARGNRHNALVQKANAGGYDIMLIGDSITELLGVNDDGGGNPGGKPEVDKYFGDAKVANFGVSGDTTQGVLWGFQNGEEKGAKPKAIMLMIGTNNSGTAPQIAEGIGADVLLLKTAFPDAKILLVGVFPRDAAPTGANRRKMADINKIIARLDEKALGDKQHVFFLDLTDKFLDANGGLVGFRTTDNLHPVSKGFDIWLANTAPILKGWVK